MNSDKEFVGKHITEIIFRTLQYFLFGRSISYSYNKIFMIYTLQLNVGEANNIIVQHEAPLVTLGAWRALGNSYQLVSTPPFSANERVFSYR